MTSINRLWQHNRAQLVISIILGVLVDGRSWCDMTMRGHLEGGANDPRKDHHKAMRRSEMTMLMEYHNCKVTLHISSLTFTSRTRSFSTSGLRDSCPQRVLSIVLILYRFIFLTMMYNIILIYRCIFIDTYTGIMCFWSDAIHIHWEWTLTYINIYDSSIWPYLVLSWMDFFYISCSLCILISWMVRLDIYHDLIYIFCAHV